VIKLTVQNYNGAPLPSPLSAQFDELGGTIGRADNNQLVLPDPERTISRVHAQIAFRNGDYAVVDRGSNPVQHNGRPLGNGQEAPLRAGDQLMIGGYLIQVDAVTSMGGGLSSAEDPFADFGGMAFASPKAAPASARAPGAGASADPLAAFGRPSGGADPFGFGGAPAVPAAAPSSAPSPAPMGGIPDDWDPFAPDPVSAPKPQDLARSLGASNSLGLELGGAASAPLVAGMGDLGGGKANTASSLDAMFGLGSSSGGDPFANSVLAQADVAPNMANHVDPLKSLDTVNRVSATAAPDNVSALSQPFMEAPMVVKPTTTPAAQPPLIPDDPLFGLGGATPAPASSPAGAGLSAPSVPPAASPASPVLSWDDGAQEGRTVIRPKAPRVGAPAPPPMAGTIAPASSSSVDPMAAFGFGEAPLGDVSAVTPASAPVSPPVVVPAPAPAPAAVAPGSSTGPADMAELVSALREGLGMPTLPVQSLTPEFMKLLGQLVHESTRGTVELLVARAALKREIRAEVTMIVAKENNPLKFSPSAEVALNHLLSPPVRGFMPAAPAMRDAYDDLRAHQFAFLAGMRAALEGVLKRFDPGVLEGKLTQKSVLSTLLPASRKARMWDVFTELYGQISAEASDDFHELFGKEFLRAYESHIDQLQRDE
jgi:FHA domain-containing protein